MSTYLQVVGANGNIIIDDTYENAVNVQKVCIADLPIIGTVNRDDYFDSDKVRNLSFSMFSDDPYAGTSTYAPACPSGVYDKRSFPSMYAPGKIFAISYSSNFFKNFFIRTNDAGNYIYTKQGIDCSRVSAFVFASSNNSPPTSNYGLQIFNSSGIIVFDSSRNYLIMRGSAVVDGGEHVDRALGLVLYDAPIPFTHYLSADGKSWICYPDFVSIYIDGHRAYQKMRIAPLFKAYGPIMTGLLMSYYVQQHALNDYQVGAFDS